MKGLHNLKPNPLATYTSKRRGRGNGSGRGSYSTRGVKGQRARSGGRSGLTARSMKPYLLRIPKVRGFKSANQQWETVNITAIANQFAEGTLITPKLLRRQGLVSSHLPVKILAKGQLTKRLTIEAHQFSASAKAMIEKAGGTTTLIPGKKVPEAKTTETK